MSLELGQGIPFEYLLCGDEIDPQEVQDTVEPLLEFELISEEKDGLFSIHRLVQLSVRSWLIANNEFAHNVEVAGRALHVRFPYPGYESWQICEQLLPHLESMLSNPFSTSDGFECQSLLCSDAAYYYNPKEHWELAVERAGTARRISEEHFPEDLHVTRYRADIAMMLAQQNLGYLKEAEETARTLLERATTGPNVDETRKTKATALLGQILAAGGQYAEAEHFTRTALQMQEKDLDQSNERILSSLANLAHVYNQTRKFTAAWEL